MINEDTRYHIIRIPKLQRFACTKRDIKEIFESNMLNWVSFGAIGKHFEFESRCHHRPEINGHIVANLTINRDNQAYLCLYPIRKDLYSNEGFQEFREKMLPVMYIWLKKKIDRTETSILSGYESLIVEWFNQQHTVHELQYL